MGNQEMLILVGHAWQCQDCRRLLLETPDKVLRGRPLSAEQRQALAALQAEHFASLADLAAALNVSTGDLLDAMNHARSRLRHF